MPLAPLHVCGAECSTPTLLLQMCSTTDYATKAPKIGFKANTSCAGEIFGGFKTSDTNACDAGIFFSIPCTSVGETMGNVLSLTKYNKVGIRTLAPEETLEVHGDSGQLLTAADDFSDVIFSANNISGLPVIEACCDSTVTIGKFGGSNFSVRGSDGCIKSVSLNARAAAFASMMG